MTLWQQAFCLFSWAEPQKPAILSPTDERSTAGFQLGVSTDTLDSTGKTLKTSDKAVTRADLECAKSSFVGDIMQVPPMYSAIKVNGKKLYELARAGKEIEREPRAVHIDSIDIIEYDEASRRGVMKVDCEKGTYIRSVISVKSLAAAE